MLTREPAMQVREHIVLDFQILNFVGLQKEMWQKGFFFFLMICLEHRIDTRNATKSKTVRAYTC